MKHDDERQRQVTPISNAAQLALARVERGEVIGDDSWDAIPDRAAPSTPPPADPDRRGADLVAAGWPRRYVREGAAAKDAWPLVQRAARWAADGHARPILILAGGVGSGKSTAATWWALRHGGRAPSFLSAERFVALSRYDDDDRARWERCSSLVLDDFGVEFLDGKGAALSGLEALVERHYADERPLLITTNMTRALFVERVGGDASRIVSRLRGAGAWFATQDGDHRRPTG